MKADINHWRGLSIVNIPIELTQDHKLFEDGYKMEEEERWKEKKAERRPNKPSE
jgi:hypothetical protein